MCQVLLQKDKTSHSSRTVTSQLTQPHNSWQHRTVTVIAMTEQSTIRVGDRVYLRYAVAGEPGCVVNLVRGKAEVHWPDMPEQRNTFHPLDTLELDTAYTVKQSAFDWDEIAA